MVFTGGNNHSPVGVREVSNWGPSNH